MATTKIISFDPWKVSIFNQDKIRKEDLSSPPQSTLDKIQDRKHKIPNMCTHQFYPTPESFIDHILYILHPQGAEQRQAMILSLSISHHILNVNLCPECINIALSKLRIETMAFYAYNVLARNIGLKMVASQNAHELSDGLALLMHQQYYNHPKMHKMIMKSLRMSKTDYLEHIAMQSLFETNKMKMTTFDNGFGIFLCHTCLPNVEHGEFLFSSSLRHYGAWLRTIYLSIRYWTDYNVAYFVQEGAVVRFMEMWNKVIEIRANNAGIDALIIVRNLLEIILEEVVNYRWSNPKCKAKKWMFGEMDRLEQLRINGEIQQTRREKREWAMELLRESITCSAIGCGRKQNECEEFKICGGCKMAYYCSRRCQKQSWNRQHRKICKKLHERYAL